MMLKTERINSFESAVVLRFDSKDIGSGAIYTIYHGTSRAMGQGPKVDAVKKTLSYKTHNKKQLQKIKKVFEQLMKSCEEY